MSLLSAYILTHNSKRYLLQIIDTIAPVVDEILVIDSGSTDGTQEMVTALPNAQLIKHPLENFKAQRNYATSICSHEHVLFLDSDELPDADFMASLAQIKAAGFPHEAYRVRRHWEVMGQPIHCIYPIVSPDGPVRLLDRRKVNFDNANIVHETPSGWTSLGEIGGGLRHITFHDQAELSLKLERYTTLAAQRLVEQGKPTHLPKALLSAIAAWIKWYGLKGGFKDGWLGLRLGVYAFQYSWKKYRKAQHLKSPKHT
ncbi:MAG: glycosyltransferase family 2 protein [Bacteroidia bacterium]